MKTTQINREQIESIMRQSTVPKSLKSIVIGKKELPVKKSAYAILDELRYGVSSK